MLCEALELTIKTKSAFDIQLYDKFVHLFIIESLINTQINIMTILNSYYNLD